MMENKYYIPIINEFCIGFEYEYKNHDGTVKDISNLKWQKATVDSINDLTYVERGLTIPNNTRVKYLDQENIEEFRFKYILMLTTRTDKYQKDKYQLYFNKESYRVRIGFDVDNEIKYVQIFDGYIKNKSELSKILKQLNIID